MELLALPNVVIGVIAPSHLADALPNGSGCGEIQRSASHRGQRAYGNQLLIEGCVLSSIDGQHVIKDCPLRAKNMKLVLSDHP